MEKVEGELAAFSAVLLQEYIRLMTAAHYINDGKEATPMLFLMSPENYEKMRAEQLQAALIGLTLTYDASTQTLQVAADEAFQNLYENKIMNEVARVYAENYKNRYAAYIKVKE